MDNTFLIFFVTFRGEGVVKRPLLIFLYWGPVFLEPVNVIKFLYIKNQFFIERFFLIRFFINFYWFLGGINYHKSHRFFIVKYKGKYLSFEKCGMSGDMPHLLYNSKKSFLLYYSRKRIEINIVYQTSLLENERSNIWNKNMRFA